MQHLPTEKIWPPKGTGCHLTVVTLGGGVLERPLGSTRDEVFLWALHQGTAERRSCKVLATALKNQSVFRVYSPSTVETGQQMGGLGAGAERPGCKETIVLLICQTHGWSKIFRQMVKTFLGLFGFPKLYKLWCGQMLMRN